MSSERISLRTASSARLRSVRARTTLVATVAVALVLVAAVAGLAVALEQSLTSQVQAQSEAEVDAVVESLRSGATPAEALEQSSGNQPGERGVPTYVAILDTRGDPVTGNVFDLPGVEEEGFSGVSATSDGIATVEVRSLGSSLAMAQQSVEIDGQVLIVVAASPLGEVVNSIKTIIDLTRIGVPILIVMVGIITWFATGRTLRPIETIRTEVEALSSQTLDHRVAVPSTGDEVSRLAETMNRMLARLDAASLRQREFVSDASHELRSPVASIRAELEVALAHPTHSTWSQVATDVLSETERLERIIDDLLLLARFDEGSPPAAMVVDMSCIAHQLTARATTADGVAIETRIDDGLRVSGSPNALASVVGNLIDNAVRHADSMVVVAARTSDDTVVITVDDDGPGILPLDRERVFQRFTRLDHPRGRADGGVGLGLAVVDRVVRQHQGTVTVEEAPRGGARFKVILPVAC